VNERTRILYITGWLRSGTTILGNVLNELPGVVHVGELHYLWQNGLLRAGTNSLCGCGGEVRACPLWSEVLGDLGAEADGGLDELAREMTGTQRAGLRTRHTRARLAGVRAGSQPPDVAVAIGRTAEIYRGVAARGGERLVVDSSKYPAEAAALIGRSDLDVRVLHVVRDPRAISYSYRSSKAYIEPMSAAESTANWVGFNAASQAVGALAPDRYLRIRHEDFTAAPRDTIEAVMRFAGLDDEPPIDRTGAVTLGVNHTVTGNPDRLSQGTVTIRSDERWRTGLGFGHRSVTNAIAAPLLRRYGYPLLRVPVSRSGSGGVRPVPQEGSA
jgi:hypothetical protein